MERRRTVRSARLIATLAAIVALLTCAGVTAAAGLGRARYTGRTSDGTPVRLRLSSDGRRVATLRIYYKVTCDDQRSGTTYTDVLNLRLGRSRKFSGSGSYTGAADGSKNEFRVSGALTASRAHGKFSLRATGTSPSSGQTVHCQTGTVTWTASRTR